MPRIRTIKPEFWTSEQVAACSRDARLLFIGLWNFCDDGGVHPASPKRVKMEVFPGDDAEIALIETLIVELISNGLLEEYSVKGKKYWHVISWKNHQRIDKPNYRHPGPENATKFDEHSTNSCRLSDEDQASSRRVIEKYSTSIHPRNGKEGNGKEDICQVADATRPASFDENSILAAHDDVRAVFSYWQQVMNKPKAKLDDVRRRKIKGALKSFSVAECQCAIDGCAQSVFHMGKNDNGKRYDGIGLIFRNPEKIEQFIAMTQTSENLSGANLLHLVTSDLMQGVI
jgi:hypothetical protein